jgi:tyrosyl-tRNA synthetase
MGAFLFLGVIMLFDDLANRGLVKQVTDEQAVRDLLNEKQITFFIGFDPTADSLHVGHLLQIVTAKRLKLAGHFPIMLVGGATAQIGDPTGKTDMRKMLSQKDLDFNIKSIRSQIIDLIHGLISIQDNSEWIDKLNFMSFIREFGVHFSVNNMLRADCFKSRMENGLSFLEFNYMLLQAFDFFHLNEKQNCVLQIGGDDQWSNILAGIDLIHKKSGNKAFGLTLPLLTNSAGQKMGKTEKGTVWLDKQKTPVFDFFQFWRNLPDEDVIKCFKFLTFLSVEEIDAIPFTTVDEMNSAKKKLAFEITKFVHGEDNAALALEQAEALFESNDLSSMEAVSVENNINVLDLVMKSGFAKSRTEARNLVTGRGISINNEVLTDPTVIISISQFGNNVLVKKGKKNFCRFNIEETHA